MHRTAPYSSNFFRDQQKRSLESAEVIVPIVLEITKLNSVIDVGCGTGTWVSEFIRNGIEDAWGTDGDYVDRSLLLIPAERFIPADLSKPLRLGRQFDLAVSLEVAEHLPPDCAAGFVTTLCGLAPRILFSAAIPYQAGEQHLFEQFQNYWCDLFRERLCAN